MATSTGSHPAPAASAEDFNQLARGLQTAFLAELLGVSKQMICRYRLNGAPESRVAVLRDYLRRQAERA